MSKQYTIPPFRGLKDIKSLPIYPLRFARDVNTREKLISRGRMLLSVAKFRSMYYTGVTIGSRDEVDSQVVVDFSEALADERGDWSPTIEPLRLNSEFNDVLCSSPCCRGSFIRGDGWVEGYLSETFVKNLLRDSSLRPPSLLLSPRPLEDTKPGTEGEPTDEELVVMTYRVFGFVLRSHKWGRLLILDVR